MKTILKSIYGRKQVEERGTDPIIREAKGCGHSPIFFAHIPKTAGTSFKKAAIEYYGESGVIRNYGPKSIETSQVVRDCLLNKTNLTRFKKKIDEDKVGCYIGHVHFQSARHAFQCTNLVTFVRNPIDQVVSHYNHYKRWHGYEKSIEEFVVTPAFRNVQHRFLAGVPIYLVGLIGLTERYRESISTYNNLFGTELECRFDNVNEEKEIDIVDEKLKILIDEYNELDVELYEQSLFLFNQRRNISDLGKEWVYGAIQELDPDNGIVKGVAFRPLSDEPVEVVLKVSGEEYSVCISNMLRPGLAQFNIPNCNLVGFKFKVSRGIDFSNISVHVRSSGQELKKY